MFGEYHLDHIFSNNLKKKLIFLRKQPNLAESFYMVLARWGPPHFEMNVRFFYMNHTP